MGRESNRSLIRETAISEPQIQGLSAEKTLIVGNVPLAWRCEWNGCFYAAGYALRTALENGCTKICVHRGAQHKHWFDVVDLCIASKKAFAPYLPDTPRLARPKFEKEVPQYLGTWKQRAVGNWMDRTRPTFQVPIALTSLFGGNRAKGV